MSGVQWWRVLVKDMAAVLNGSLAVLYLYHTFPSSVVAAGRRKGVHGGGNDSSAVFFAVLFLPGADAGGGAAHTRILTRPTCVALIKQHTQTVAFLLV